MDPRGGCAAFRVTGIENGQTFDRSQANQYRRKQATVGSEGEGKMKPAPSLKFRAWTAEDDDRLKSLMPREGRPGSLFWVGAGEVPAPARRVHGRAVPPLLATNVFVEAPIPWLGRTRLVVIT
jgi:hypothetical protein